MGTYGCDTKGGIGVLIKRGSGVLSLRAQWLRIRLPVQRIQVWIPGCGNQDPTCLRAAKPVCCNYLSRQDSTKVQYSQNKLNKYFFKRKRK